MKNHEVKLLETSKIIPYPDNPKLHSDEQIAILAGRIKIECFNQPIVVDTDHVVVKGHGRRLAAIKLGLEQVPVVILEGMDKSEIKAARLADNKISDLTGYDESVLSVETEGIKDLGLDLLDLGFIDLEIMSMDIDSIGEAADDEADNPKHMAENLEGFLDAQVKKISFIIPNESYDELVAGLNELQERYEFKNHTDVIMRLVNDQIKER